MDHPDAIVFYLLTSDQSTNNNGVSARTNNPDAMTQWQIPNKHSTPLGPWLLVGGLRLLWIEVLDALMPYADSINA